MSREIKFRAWSNNQDFMFPWKDIYLGGSETTLKDVYDGLKSSGFVLMQYTGLKDKNGKEIYEGDIVAEKEKDFHENPIETRYEVKIGLFDNDEEYEDRQYGCGVFLVERVFLRRGEIESCTNEVYNYDGLYGLDRLEVIGNIYENEELLKGSNE